MEPEYQLSLAEVMEDKVSDYMKQFDVAIEHNLLFPYKNNAEDLLDKLNNLKEVDRLTLEYLICETKKRIGIFNTLANSIQKKMELTVLPDINLECRCYDDGYMVIQIFPQSGYQVFRFEVVRKDAEFQNLDLTVFSVGSERLDEAIAKIPNDSKTIVICKGTGQYPLYETVIPLINSIYQRMQSQ